MDVRVGLWRKLSAEELMLLNCGVGEDSWESQGDQPWDFFRGNDAEAETPVLWPPHAKGWLIRKDSDAGRDWGQEEKGTTEDGCESEWTLGVCDGQGGLAWCDSWGRKELYTTERLNWTDSFQTHLIHSVLQHFIYFTALPILLFSWLSPLSYWKKGTMPLNHCVSVPQT